MSVVELLLWSCAAEVGLSSREGNCMLTQCLPVLPERPLCGGYIMLALTNMVNIDTVTV